MPWPQNHIAALSLYWNICYEIPYLCTVTRNICPLIHHGKSISWFSRHNILWWKRAISSRVISFIKKEMYFGKTINITRPSKKTPIRYRLETIISIMTMRQCDSVAKAFSLMPVSFYIEPYLLIFLKTICASSWQRKSAKI
jgi:hypothetical protein